MTTIYLLWSRPKGSKVWTIHHHTPFKADDKLDAMFPGSRHREVPAYKSSRCTNPEGIVRSIEQDARMDGLETHVSIFEIPD